MIFWNYNILIYCFFNRLSTGFNSLYISFIVRSKDKGINVWQRQVNFCAEDGATVQHSLVRLRVESGIDRQSPWIHVRLVGPSHVDPVVIRHVEVHGVRVVDDNLSNVIVHVHEIIAIRTGHIAGIRNLFDHKLDIGCWLTDLALRGEIEFIPVLVGRYIEHLAIVVQEAALSNAFASKFLETILTCIHAHLECWVNMQVNWVGLQFGGGPDLRIIANKGGLQRNNGTFANVNVSLIHLGGKSVVHGTSDASNGDIEDTAPFTFGEVEVSVVHVGAALVGELEVLAKHNV